MKKNYFNCKRFESYTNPCPHKENEDLTAIRDWASMEPPTKYLGEEIIRAETVCLACDFFDPIKLEGL